MSGKRGPGRSGAAEPTSAAPSSPARSSSVAPGVGTVGDDQRRADEPELADRQRCAGARGGCRPRRARRRAASTRKGVNTRRAYIGPPAP